MASLRSELNSNQPNRLADDVSKLQWGEILSFLLEKATATETGVVPSSNVATLANLPTQMFQVNVTAGATTGIFKLRFGVVGTDVPNSGEALWQVGTKKVAFAAADAVTAVNFTYCQSTDKASLLEGSIP